MLLTFIMSISKKFGFFHFSQTELANPGGRMEVKFNGVRQADGQRAMYSYVEWDMWTPAFHKLVKKTQKPFTAGNQMNEECNGLR